MFIVAGDVLVNLDNVKTISLTNDGTTLEITYPDETLTEVRYADYGAAMTALKTIISKIGVDTDVGGELVE